MEGFWTLQAQIISANTASIKLFEKAGFRQIGYRERYGEALGVWHDVMLFERRSNLAGGEGLPTKSCE